MTGKRLSIMVASVRAIARHEDRAATCPTNGIRNSAPSTLSANGLQPAMHAMTLEPETGMRRWPRQWTNARGSG